MDPQGRHLTGHRLAGVPPSTSLVKGLSVQLLRPTSRRLGLAAVLGPALSGCPVEHAPNPEHCYYAGGDQTCVDRYGAERPFCASPTDTCPTADYGCVSDLPNMDCYSPCGNGTVASEDMTCLEFADESDTNSEDTDTDTGSEGDPPPACGDGITQASLGETCDDGNTDSGDACAWNCTLPGTEIWSRTYADLICDEAVVEVTATDQIYLVVDCDTHRRILRLDAEGTVLRIQTTPLDELGKPNLALLSNGSLILGGRDFDGTEGLVHRYNFVANFQWSHEIPLEPSYITAVAASEADEFVAAGMGAGAPILYSYSPTGTVTWFLHDLPSPDPITVEISPSGAIWSLHFNPIVVEKRSIDGSLDWSLDDLSSEYVRDLAIATDEHAYLVGYSFVSGTDNFRVQKLDPAGESVWVRIHDDPGVPELASSVEVLPGGGALVVGYQIAANRTNTAGLLSWYAPDGTNLLDVVYDGPTGEDAQFVDVAVSNNGYAIAAGLHDLGNGTTQLWLLKFVI